MEINVSNILSSILVFNSKIHSVLLLSLNRDIIKSSKTLRQST